MPTADSADAQTPQTAPPEPPPVHRPTRLTSGVSAVVPPIVNAPPAAAPDPEPQPVENSIKETIESILVAFILAFIFRAFIVEAFVIPTGSMAPTLLGAHMRFDCVDCGYHFEVNYSGRSVGDDVEIPSRAIFAVPGKPSIPKVFGLQCPNCGMQVPRDNKRSPDNAASGPPVFYGDRILVLKYAYLLNDPGRWDVVVFKSPKLERGVPDYTINYIKRLVGKPHESVMILDGDVYVGHQGDDIKAFKIQRKTRVAQEALWRVVYDNDFLPHRDGFNQPWTPEEDGASSWKLANADRSRSRVFNHEGPQPGWIRFDPAANPEMQPFTDWLAYDITRRQQPENGDSRHAVLDAFDLRRFGERAQNTVSDLKLACTYERLNGDGPIRLQLTKLGKSFTAEIDSARVRLLRSDAGGAETEIANVAKSLSASTPYRLEFENVDYRVALRIDNQEVVASEYDPDISFLADRHDKAPRERLALPEVRIGVEGHNARLTHVGLWRDIYYLNVDDFRWGSPEQIIHLGDDEYFVLGDNSLISGDARVWTDDIDLPAEGLKVDAGRVPGRFMLGKAFFVYWPAGYRPFESGPGFVPNFGDMRFIH